MVTVPLGMSAYKRTFAGEPEIRLINRFMETAPTNLREKVALISRAGTDSLFNVGASEMRGSYSEPGLFNGDLFTVFGTTLYRFTTLGQLIPITGTVQNNGFTYAGWMKGIGYEYLFISDGESLQYYTTHALGTLTVTGDGAEIGDFRSGGQSIEIGGTYYAWSADVNSGAPDGSSGNPYLALLGTDVADANGFLLDQSSLSEMSILLNFSGTSGDDYSNTVPGPSADVSATSTFATLVVTAIADLTTGNLVTTSSSGADIAWGSTTLTGGGNQALQTVAGMGDGEVPLALTPLSSYMLVSVGNSQKFYWINPGETWIDPLNFASKESNPDNITSMSTIGDQAIICGAGSTENWYATGNFDAPFAPVEGRVYRRGCLEGTEVVVKDALMLVGDDGIVYTIGYNWGDTSQYGVHRTSTHGIEERIRTQMRILQGLPA